jgi:spore coat polysaccharide biosynthesis protein SpsF
VSARTTLCVVQARTGSTRLPGKVLRDLGGRPLLRFMLDRLVALDVDEVVVATSALDRDDPVAAIAHDAGRPVVRGSENDVLARFVDAIDAFPADHVVRLTADCPLADPDVIERVLAHHLATGADYTSNVFPRTFPKGLDVEVARAEALRTAHHEARDPVEREHVMPFLYRRPDRFRLANLRVEAVLGRERWTVDTAEDLARVRSIVSAAGHDGRFGWLRALDVAGVCFPPAPDELALRPAAASDREFVLECRNDPGAVAWSRSKRPIGVDEHASWYRDHLDDPGVRLWVVERRAARIGTVRVDVHDAVGEVGIALARRYRGQGLAAPVLDALKHELAADPQVVELVAHVHRDNEPSRRAFVRAGFEPVDVAEPEPARFVRLRAILGTEPDEPMEDA